MSVDIAAAERNRAAREQDRRTFERGDVVVFGKGRAAWVISNADPERNLYSIASDRAARYLLPEDLERIRVIHPAHLAPDLSTPKGRIVANLRARQNI